MSDRIAELEARVKELEEAIEWALGEGDSDFGDNIPPGIGKYWWRKELRARAFPPQFEEIEVKKYFCPKCETFFGEGISLPWECCDGTPLVEMTGHFKRPIVAKKKVREEIVVVGRAIVKDFPAGTKYFAEYEK